MEQSARDDDGISLFTFVYVRTGSDAGRSGQNDAHLPRSYTDAARILNYITGAVEEGRIAGFFVHPHYFCPNNADTEWALSALRMAMAFWEVNGYDVCLLTIDDVARFWDKRKDVQITAQNDGFVVNTETPMAVSLPASVTSVSVDGTEAEIIIRTVSGRERKYVVLPEAGQHTITVNN